MTAVRHNGRVPAPLVVELLWWRGCPSTEVMASQLEAALADVVPPGARVERREVEDEAQAEREGFVGSPTVRVDGRELFPPDPGEPAGLSCRVYRLRDGRFSPTPDPADLRDALRGAAASRSPT
jgi:hypothetical protein